MVDRRAHARRAGRTRAQAPAGHSRLAAGVKAALDLYRGTAELRQPENSSRPYELRARVHLDRPVVVVRTKFAKHPDPHRGWPEDSPSLRCSAGQKTCVGGLLAN